MMKRCLNPLTLFLVFLYSSLLFSKQNDLLSPLFFSKEASFGSNTSEKNENFLISPFLLYKSFDLMEALSSKGSEARMTPAAKKRFSDLLHIDLFKKTTTPLIANALWIDLDSVCEREYFIKHQLGYSVFKVDFELYKQSSKKISKWIENKTSQDLHDILYKKEWIDNDKILSTQTLLFKKTWRFPFSPVNTAKAIFHISQEVNCEIDMMNQLCSFAYFENEKIQAVILPFEQKKNEESSFHLVLILPAVGLEIIDFYKDLTSEPFKKFLNNPIKKMVDLRLPKNTISSDASLNDLLTNPSLQSYLKSRLPDDLETIAPSSVFYQSLLQMNEHGCCVRATKRLPNVSTLLPGEDVINFHLNRPFLFFIFDKKNNMVFLEGVVNNPLKG
ncbi:MAG: serpin family protein [Rhabdochlamydiaceae bacterium]